MAKVTVTAFLLISLILVSVELSDMKVKKLLSSPDWVQLCDEGHQYLFSDNSANWYEAEEMCQSFGGYLVRIENRHENNCILVYAQTNNLHDWWWTSGIRSLIPYPFIRDSFFLYFINRPWILKEKKGFPK